MRGIFSKKLVLHVQESVDYKQEGKFLVPTLADPLPALTDQYLFGDFTLSLPDDEWRQLEFLPNAQVATIQEMTNAITAILTSTTNDQALLGYDTQHLRSDIGQYGLDIPFTEFCVLINSLEKGNISISQRGFVENGFAIRSDTYTYYGRLEDGRIRELALQQFDSVDDEFVSVVSTYGLVLVDWCNANILLHELNMDEAETPVAI